MSLSKVFPGIVLAGNRISQIWISSFPNVGLIGGKGKERGFQMIESDRATWRHSNQYDASVVCAQCEGAANQHEPWCPAVNPFTNYAYSIVRDPSRLTEWDRLSLHSLGVLWDAVSASTECEHAPALRRLKI